jgi:ABC-2 type transport system ATP-binding protein
MELAIRTSDLDRIYKIRGHKKEKSKQLVALKGINIEVQPGELFGLLGPNGAGKTTLIKILTTLLSPSSGKAWVSGFDVSEKPEQVRRRINMVSGGETSGYGLLTVRENLWMFSQFYGIPSKIANARIRYLLDVVGLSDRTNTKSADLSTGLRQKMNIVRGFMTDPEVLFLDEPTLGLDVGAARDVREFIQKWMEEDSSRTVMLTTHYMVEADDLCNRVAIINQGKVLACDKPKVLKRRLQQHAIFTIEIDTLDNQNLDQFEQISGVKKVTQSLKDGVSELGFILESDDVLGGIISSLSKNSIHILNLQKREPTLEDVFIDLVGRSMEEVEQSD